jgi:predicted ATPase/class 3 adenylate cyclase
MRADLPRGTVTLLFTDIEGSTRVLHALGPDAYAEALAEHRRIVRDALARHGGSEVDTQGDAFFVAFPTAEGAASAALEAQQGLAGGPISVRMGLHTGAPSLTAEGYVGIDVHRGARVAALAHGGQIVVSPASAALLDASLRDLGLHRLKDFEGATRLAQLGDGEFPPLRTPGSVELPTPATRFVGRERELFEAVSLVYERDPRILTILGPGGTGKTRFAIELARLLAEDADGGTVFVPLTPLRDPELALRAIADRLGSGSADVPAIAARVGDKRTRIVCDNFEHLLPSAARFLAELVAAAPELRLLATSRETLRVQGEVEVDLPPLVRDDAVALFCERAQAVRPGIEPTDDVRELCARLDHLPLALELAAARTKVLAPSALLERLGNRLDTLRGARDVDDRHTTLRATIEWSYSLLEPSEQQLFAGLAVFRGGCTLESAETVCNADLDTLASLLDKSLLRRRTDRLGEERFWMLEIIREFAAERLEESGEADGIRHRYAGRMLEIAREAHLTEEDDEPFRLVVALVEEADMRGAIDWASDHDPELALELIVSLENFWNTQAHTEVLVRLDELVPRAVEAEPSLRAGALRVRGGALHVDGDFDSCDAPYEESLALYRALGDARGVASLLQRLANSALQRGELDRAQRFIEESQELARDRFPFIAIPNDSLLAQIHLARGDVEAGTALLRRSADMAGEANFDWWRAGQLAHLGFFALERGDLVAAERDSRKAIEILRPDENRLGVLLALTVLARVALARGDAQRAGTIWGALEAEHARTRSRIWEQRRRQRAGPLPSEDDPRFVAAADSARDLDFWDAVAIALDELEPPQTVP